MELERRNSGDEQEEGAENVQSAEEKRRLDRLEREKWLQGKYQRVGKLHLKSNHSAVSPTSNRSRE